MFVAARIGMSRPVVDVLLSRLRPALAALVLVALPSGLGGCATEAGEPAGLVGVDEPDDGEDTRGAESVVGAVSVGQQLKTSADLNLRTGPTKSNKILLVIPSGSIVTAVSASPSNGWYNVKHAGQTGWVYGVYLDKVTGVTGPVSCDPARATGAVPTKHGALLDTIAFAEGTAGRGYDGYNVLFAYQMVTDCNKHPDRRVCSGSYCSTAAGRYQFLTTTWNGLGLPNFRPENQEKGAMTLVSRRKATVPSDRALTATEFANVMDRISWEWASLPPGRYGQPQKSLSSLRAEYCKHAGC